MNSSRLKSISKLIVLFSILIISDLISQMPDDILSNRNRIAFGDHLFCDRDYLRAINEFKAVLEKEWDDSLQFKVAASYYRMGMFENSIIEYQKIVLDNNLIESAYLESIRSYYMIGDYKNLRDQIGNYFAVMGESKKLSKLYNYSLLMDRSELPEKSEYLKHFNNRESEQISYYFNWKSDPPYKSPTKGAVMSAIIPGLGKVYADEVGDGITAFLLTGLFTYLAIDKFQNDHTASGWIFASIATFFYAGNIYGSATAVQNYNAGIKFNFDKEVKIYLNERDQFIPLPKHLCN